MSQRANYILKQGDIITIYFSQWGGGQIACQLLAGPADFLDIVKDNEVVEELTPFPWLEGFAIIDTDKKDLVFHESAYLNQTTARREYLKLLEGLWPGWDLIFAENYCGVLEDAADQDYSKKHSEDDLKIKPVEKLAKSDPDYSNLAVLLTDESDNKQIFYFESGPDQFILNGPELIPFLQSRKPGEPLHESESDFLCVIVINLPEKRIILNESIPLLREKLTGTWPGWEIIVSDIGYIGHLENNGINCENLKLSPADVDEIIEDIKNFE